MNHTLYVKGVDCGIVKLVKSSAKSCERSLNEQCGQAGPVRASEWRLTGESLRLSALTDDQYDKILHLTDISGHAAVLSRPWCIDRIEKATARA